MHSRLTVLGYAATLALLLAGCGQKGPLYLPLTPPRTIPPLPATKPPAATTTPAAPRVNPPPPQSSHPAGAQP